MRIPTLVLAGAAWLAVTPVLADAGKPAPPPDEAAAAERDLALFRGAIEDIANLVGRILSGEFGKGPAMEPEVAKSTPRQARALRWRIVFDTKDGEDYRKQLAALGA